MHTKNQIVQTPKVLTAFLLGLGILFSVFSGGHVAIARAQGKAATTDLIFKDDFSGDDCSFWWSSCKRDNVFDLQTDAYPGLTAGGFSSMRILIDDNNTVFVTSDHPNAEPRYRVRFYFTPRCSDVASDPVCSSFKMANGDSHTIFAGYKGTSKMVLRVLIRCASASGCGANGTNYQLRASLLTDSSSWKDTSWFTIKALSGQFYELDWRVATAAGANNGGLTLWIDGTRKANLTGVDNDTWRIDRARLGGVAGIDTGTRNYYFFDEFESRRQTYIGP